MADSTVLPELLLHGEERKVGGRQRLSGPDRSHPGDGSEGPGHDLPQNKVQALCGRVTEKEEPEWRVKSAIS